MIEEMKADFGVAFLARKLGVSERGFYAWKSRPLSSAGVRRWELDAHVWRAFIDAHRADGHRKITHALAEAGLVVNRKTVHASMRRQHLMPPAAAAAFRTMARRARTTKDPEDLINRDFGSTTVGAALVSDITYVATSEGWVYLATVIDLASKAVLGAASGKRQTTALILRAAKQALATGRVQPGAVFHSDHGIQYRSKRFTDFCRRNGLRQSMGARYQCWDNAVAEGFFSRLKNERLRWIEFTTRAQASREIADYIRHFNHGRRHQTLGYLTPAKMIERLTTAAATPAAA